MITEEGKELASCFENKADENQKMLEPCFEGREEVI